MTKFVSLTRLDGTTETINVAAILKMRPIFVTEFDDNGEATGEVWTGTKIVFGHNVACDSVHTEATLVSMFTA